MSPDGKWIAFCRREARSTPPWKRRPIPSRSWRRTASATKRRNDTEIFILPVAACEHQTAECSPRKLEYAGNETQIAWSPDSKRIAFVGQPSRYRNQRLFVVNADGGKAQDILGAWAYEPGQIEWLKDGQIAMVAPTGGSTGLYTIDPTSHKITTVLGGRRQVSALSYDKPQQHVVYVSTDLTHPTELYVANADGTNERASRRSTTRSTPRSRGRTPSGCS